MRARWRRGGFAVRVIRVGGGRVGDWWDGDISVMAVVEVFEAEVCVGTDVAGR